MTSILKDNHDGYKMTELGEIPLDWEIYELSEVVDKIVGGGTPSRKIEEYYNGSIPWVTVKDMNSSFYKDNSKEHINEIAIKDSSTNLIDEHQVIIATRMALGRGFINTRPIAINQDLKALYLKKNITQPAYFLYWYLNKAKEIEAMGSGSTVKGIRLEQLRMLKLPLPPIKEQQKITEILSTVDEKIENTDQLIAKTKELKKGLLQQLLTKGIGHSEFKQTELGEIPIEWEVTTLSEVSDFITKGSTPTTYGYEWVESGIQFFKSDVVKEGRFVYGDYKFISEEAHRQMSRSIISSGDILITITGNIGRVAIVPKVIKEANINQHIARIRIINESVNPLFVYQWLNQEKFVYYYHLIKTGLAYPQISLKQVRETIVPIPSNVEQHEIVNILSTVDEQIEIYEQEKEKYTELKKGLMQQLLTGKLRVMV